MLRNLNMSSKSMLGCLVAFGLFAPLSSAGAKASLTVLYSFCNSPPSCTDGLLPQAGLIADTSRNLYGTTWYGGANNYGTLFELTPKGKESVLYSFCSEANCIDGNNPGGDLIIDTKGNLYGMTSSGGGGNQSLGGGTIFKVTPKGNETVLYSFCSQSQCADGAGPGGGLVMDKPGNLYGTTYLGGKGSGIVFKLAPDGVFTVLYDFCSQSNCTDGGNPQAGLIMDMKGNLYGTTEGGGACCGTVFTVTPKGKEKVLYAFKGGNDGSEPYAPPIMDKGNLYGTTLKGGADNSGTVFKLTPDGKESLLWTFNGSSTGGYPIAGLLMGKNGNLYSTTVDGGGANLGTVFELTPKGKESVLYSFCSEANCIDGEQPYDRLIADGAGNLYGTTTGGGANVQYSGGIVFKLSQ